MEELRILLQRKNSAREEVRKYLHRNSNYVFFICLFGYISIITVNLNQVDQREEEERPEDQRGDEQGRQEVSLD